MNEEASDLIKQRIEKVESLRKKGVNPYPSVFFRTDFSQDIKANFIEGMSKEVCAAGRLRTKRPMGKAAFAHIEDITGSIQIYAKLDNLGEYNYGIFRTFDIGDIIGIKGTAFKTKQGEISINASEITLLAKCIRPLPVVKEKDGLNLT